LPHGLCLEDGDEQNTGDKTLQKSASGGQDFGKSGTRAAESQRKRKHILGTIPGAEHTHNAFGVVDAPLFFVLYGSGRADSFASLAVDATLAHYNL
jgi:hypothetical protein